VGESNNQTLLRDTIQQTVDRLYAEQEHQFNKFGDQFHTPDQWVSIITEEWGEAVAGWNNADYEEAIDEAQQTIMCIIQFIHEVRRLQGGRTDGQYSRQK
jgi:NTP pyrophosphatase (non-canonical NTP hydrolase)